MSSDELQLIKLCDIYAFRIMLYAIYNNVACLLYQL